VECVCGILGFVIAEVIATYGRHLLLRDAVGTQYRARPLGRRLEIVCGDRVECEFHGEELLVSGALPRSTFLRRSTSRGRSEPLAANLSRMAVVLAPLPAPDLFMVDRYLCAAECAGLAALIIANKSDLPEAAALHQTLTSHASLGYPILDVTVRGDAAALQPLRGALAVGTTILVGQSGVGKSSLTQLLAADAADIAIGELMRDEEGRHTTTASRLYECDGGGRIMDSPGVRDFAPAIDDLDPANLGFREVAALAPGCRFHDCLHMHEPGCAVRKATDDGSVDARRYESYRRLRRLYAQLWGQRPAGERAARPR
jgi:ribosome biogenesis GTPase / thiamine phosphate phosphatase